MSTSQTLNGFTISNQPSSDRVRSYLKFTLTKDGKSTVITGDYRTWSVDAKGRHSGISLAGSTYANDHLEMHGYPRLEAILKAFDYDFASFADFQHLATDDEPDEKSAEYWR
jgi:hypothetical protein